MMRLILCAALLATAAAEATPPPPPPPPPKGPELAATVAPVSADRLKRTVEKLVGFGTRHTLSSQTDRKRGIGAAVRWAEGEMKALGLETLQTCETVTLTPRQLQINQRIYQAAVRRANRLTARFGRGLTGDDFRPGSITAIDLGEGIR